jgi:hypothetical protein
MKIFTIEAETNNITVHATVQEAEGSRMQSAFATKPVWPSGFLSGTVGKKMGLTVVSTKAEDGSRTYSIKG